MLRASLWWWRRGCGAIAEKQEFADSQSDDFNEKLSDLLNDDSVVIIEIFKGESPQQAIRKEAST